MSRNTNFYPLSVAKRVDETDDAVSLYFEIPLELEDVFRYEAGQYLTLRFMIDGEEQRRSYSICTPKNAEQPAILVKKVKKGVVSNHIYTEVQEGTAVDVMPPDGRFIVKPDPEQRRTYYFIAAGSGITPLRSQIMTLLDAEAMSSLHLFYGNQKRESIIFNKDLDALAEKYDGQLTVDHILSRPEKTGILGGLFGKSSTAKWMGEKGRITPDRVLKFIEEYPDNNGERGFYLCGPGDMIEKIKDALISHGVDGADIHAEYFTPADVEAKEITSPTGGAQLIAHLNGERLELPIAEKTILETLMDAGHDPPYSCTSGACATCMAKVIEGSAEMEMCFALNDDEVKEGFILTCQSHPTSAVIEISYDV